MNAPHRAHPGQNEQALCLIRAAMDLLGRDDAHSIVLPPGRQATDPAMPFHRAQQIAEDVYRLRSIRAELLDADLFGEPAWDILIDLFIQQAKGKQVSVTSSCIASRVPATTSLRWISVLIERGYVQRSSDPADRRRAFVRLTPSGHEKLGQIFSKFGADRPSL